ncbi:EAL domain-containing protein [Halalkalibacillus halophilus]|uniref:EAL domain-containing protein n=1 Tax=Halalkalibacillus halophilus TaxID=392827 RepID=UPI000422A07D|nr:EAL domain-containing protein [Halalkalibacillus halophilus]
MQALCNYCGTVSPLLEEGYLNIHNGNESFKLIEKKDNENFYKNGNFLSIHYNDVDQITPLLKLFIDKGYGNEWVRLTNRLEMERPTHLTIYHLYHRALNPELVEIIKNEQFETHIQPIFDLQKNNLYGYESLLRTTTSDVSPGKLFRFADESGLHSYLDQRARKLAIETKVERIGPGLHCFINFLPSSIYNADFCLQHTFSIVEEHNVSQDELIFEVVETEQINDTDHLKTILEKYQSSGMRVALDDVGSGFNNLEMLTKLKPDIIKIDRSYVDRCYERPESEAFIYQAIQLGEKLNIITLAEGIETEQELLWLKNKGIDLAQGYYLGKPSKDAIHDSSVKNRH